MPWGQNPECQACGKAVYFSEQKFAIGKTFHAKCLKCAECGKTTDSTTTNQQDSTVYCKTCFKNLYGAATTSSTRRSNSITMPIVSELAEMCPRCNKTVYFAEKVMALNLSWHRFCLTCTDCKRKLEAGSLSDHDGEVFCGPCYGRKYGAKGYGYGVGAGILQSY